MLGTDEDPDYISPAAMLAARNAWIGAINMFEVSLAATDYTETEKASILATLRAAQQRAARARKKPAADSQPDSQTDNHPVGEEPTQDVADDVADTIAEGAATEQATEDAPAE